VHVLKKVYTSTAGMTSAHFSHVLTSVKYAKTHEAQVAHYETFRYICHLFASCNAVH